MAKKTKLHESADKGEGSDATPMERFKGLTRQLLSVSREELRKEQQKYEQEKKKRTAKRSKGDN